MRRAVLISFASVVAAGVLLGAGPLWATTLEDVLIKVYLENPRLQAARARLRATDEDVAKARSGWRPSLRASSGATVDQASSSEGSATLQTLHQSLSLDQPLYTGGATAAGVRRAEDAVQAERARLAATEQQVLLETTRIYSAVVRDRELLEIARQNELGLKEVLAAARDRYRFGEVTRTDVAQAETRYSGGIAERAAAEGQLALSSADFTRVAGLPPGDLAEPQPVAELPRTEEAALALAEQQPAVRAALHDVEATQEAVDIALAQLSPRLTLNGQIGYTSQPSVTVNWQSDLALGATLTVPLYQGGSEYAAVRQAKQLLVQRRYDLDDTRRDATRDVRAAWQALLTATTRIRSLQAQARAAEIALEGVRQEALIGARTVLDVLDAEQEVAGAHAELARAEDGRVVAGYTLRAATGTLTADRLTLPVARYDPSAYYRATSGKWFGLGPPVDGETDAGPAKAGR
jgi:TolC family type I secretion outer membrane protein